MTFMSQPGSFMHSNSRPVGTGGGFLPTNISNLVGWYDCSDATTMFTDTGCTTAVADGNNIACLQDKGPNGNDLTEGTDDNRPSYHINVQNGLSISRYDISSGTERLTNTGPNETQPFTAAYVGVNPSFVATSETFIALNSENAGIFHLATSGNIRANFGTAFDTGDNTNAWHVLVTIISGASSEIFLDGVSIGVGDVGSNDLSLIKLGAFGDDTSGLIGDIGEAVIYANGISSANRVLLETYLKDKWGI